MNFSNWQIVRNQFKPVLIATGLMLLVLFWQQSVKITFNVKEVSVSEAKSLMDGGALVIDARGKDAFDEGHIFGAISMPLAQIAGRQNEIASSKEESIIVYCGDGTTIGPEATDKLNRSGYPHAVNLKGGIEGWRANGMRIQKP